MTNLSLEELGTRAEGRGGDLLALVREKAANAARFKEVRANDAHRAIALLLREGAAFSLTVNWDCGVENAGAQLGFAIERVVCQRDVRDVSEPRQVKLHGCATRPPALLITRAEIDAPPNWVRTHAANALQSATVLFLGLGTVGAYVSEGLRLLA